MLSYMANPQLELVLVMLIVPFIVNVCHFYTIFKLFFFFVNACAVLTSVSPAPPTGGDVLGGGQSDHEEVQEPEES